MKILADLTDKTGFDSAVDAVSRALLYDVSDAESIKNLYRRLYSDIPELPPMEYGIMVPKVEDMPVNIGEYDEFLGKGGPANV